MRNAREILFTEWLVLKDESDLAAEFPNHAAQLKDLLSKETFYRELAAITQHANAIKTEYSRRHSETSSKRVAVYSEALTKVASVPGWDELTAAQREKLAAPLKGCAQPASLSTGLALLRSDIDACPSRTQKVIEEMLRLIDGSRLVRIDIGKFFSGGIETTEQLDVCIAKLKEECERQIAEGKRILIQ